MSLSATTSCREAAGRIWDAIVIGAGPAGSLAARELRRRGLTVLLVDKSPMPRWKVCGSCLNGQSLSVLRAVALPQLTRRLRAIPLTSVLLGAKGLHASIALPSGEAVSRQALDAALAAEAIGEGVQFLPNTNAALGALHHSSRMVRLSMREGTTEAAARVVIAASGLAGGLLPRQTMRSTRAAHDSRLGAGCVLEDSGPSYQSGTIFMACGAGGYVGLVRLEDGRLDVAAALDRNWLQRHGSPGRGALAVLHEAGLPDLPMLQTDGWRGTPALTQRPRRIALARLFAVGDAAGYVEPFTGQGIAWALSSALAVIPFAWRAVHSWRDSLADEWTSQYRQKIGRQQRICRVAAAVLRSPWITALLVRVLSAAPALALPVVQRLNRSTIPFPGTAP